MADEDQGPVEEPPQEPAALPESPEEIEPATGWGRVVAWFERPATLLDLGGVGVLVVAALAGYAVLSLHAVPRSRTPRAARPMGASLSPQHVAWLLGLPEKQVVPAGIEIAGRPDAVFGPGDPLRLRISLRAPARVAVLEEPAGGSRVQAWPGLSQAPALVPPPSSGGPAIQTVSLEAPSVEGTHRLRLVVAPADLDLGALSPADLPDAMDRLTIVDLRYRVTRR
jgi:hypothetical protein